MKTLAAMILVFCVTCCAICTLLVWDGRNAIDALARELNDRYMSFEMQKARGDYAMGELEKAIKRLNKNNQPNKEVKQNGPEQTPPYTIKAGGNGH